MNLSEADIILLEDYWAGQLTAEETANLEARLAKDLAFKTAAAEWKLIVTEGWQPTAEEAAEQAVIRNRLLSYADATTSQSTGATVAKLKPIPRQRALYIGLAAAASIALVWWIGGIFGQSNPSQDYFAHLSRENANLSDQVRDGKKAYDQRDYEVAYPALIAEVAAGEDSLNLLYAGVAAIGSGQADKAIPIFAPLVDQTNWAFYQAEIQWYLALAYLDTGDQAKAIEHLQTVINANGLYAEDAKTLMTQIK